MTGIDYARISKLISEDLRLKTFPVAVKFLESEKDFPAKTRRPSKALKKRITLCQAVTMARTYGWTVGLTRADLICVPAMIAFGYSNAPDPGTTLGELFCEVDFAGGPEKAKEEIDSMSRLENDQQRAIVMAPLFKALFEPDTIAVYGNPAQIMRMVQAVVYVEGRRLDRKSVV